MDDVRRTALAHSRKSGCGRTRGRHIADHCEHHPPLRRRFDIASPGSKDDFAKRRRSKRLIGGGRKADHLLSRAFQVRGCLARAAGLGV